MNAQIGLDFQFHSKHRNQHDQGLGIGVGGAARPIPNRLGKAGEFEKGIERFFLVPNPGGIEFGNRRRGRVCVHAPSIAQPASPSRKTPRLLD